MALKQFHVWFPDERDSAAEIYAPTLGAAIQEARVVFECESHGYQGDLMWACETGERGRVENV